MWRLSVLIEETSYRLEYFWISFQYFADYYWQGDAAKCV